MSPGASEGDAQTEVTQTEVTRTASRGLFRRRPERPARPAARPPQRRVAELIAEAERDRVAPRPDPAAERSAGPARPGRPGPGADDPGRGAARPEPGEAPPASARGGPASVPHERRSADGSEGSRSNGFVPRGLTHDEFGMPPVVDDGDAAPTGYIPNGAAYGTNGSANGASYWANGAGYGPSPEEPAVHDVPLDRADDHPPQADGRYANGTHVNGGYVNGAYADWMTRYDDGAICRRCVCRPGLSGRFLAPRLAQPRRLRVRAVGQRLVGLRAVHRRGAIADGPSREHASPGPETSWYGPTGPSARTGSRVPAGSSGPTGITWPVPGATPISGSRPPPGRPSSAPGRRRPPRPPMPGRTTGPCRCPSSGRHRYPSRSRFAGRPSGAPVTGALIPGGGPAQQACPPGSRGAGRRVAGLGCPAGDTRAVAAGASAGRAAAVAVGRVRMGGRRDVGPWGTGPGRARLGPAPARRPPRRRTRRRPHRSVSPSARVGARAALRGARRRGRAERTGRATAGPSTDRPTTEGAAHPARTLCRARALHSPVHTGCTTPRGRGPRGQPPVARLS